MTRRYNSAGSRVPVAMASVLIAVCITGARLYSSSVASAGLAEQISETCRDASALTLPIYGNVATTEGTVREVAEPLVFVEPVRRGAFARPLFTLSATVTRRMKLLADEPTSFQDNAHTSVVVDALRQAALGCWWRHTTLQ